MNYYISTSKEEIDSLFEIYFFVVRGRYLVESLKYFSEYIGFSAESVGISFRNSFDTCDEEHKIMKDNQICISVSIPSREKDTEAFIDFDCFYTYLKKEVEKNINEDPHKDSILSPLLDKVRIALNIDH